MKINSFKHEGTILRVSIEYIDSFGDKYSGTIKLENISYSQNLTKEDVKQLVLTNKISQLENQLSYWKSLR